MKRVIPVLLIESDGLVKSVKFKNKKYVGDYINAVKIFNEKEVDEIVILDIEASKKGGIPDINMIKSIAGEAFMPLAYGGGIKTIEQVKEILFQGVEKVIFNTSLYEDPLLIKNVVERFGASTVVASIDVKKNLLGKYQVYSKGGSKKIKGNLTDIVRGITELGVGEIIINSIDLDGTYKGYDIELIKKIVDAVEVPVIACGGAKDEDDLVKVIKEGNAAAAAAGSIFVFKGVHKAVLINYPNWNEIQNRLN